MPILDDNDQSSDHVTVDADDEKASSSDLKV